MSILASTNANNNAQVKENNIQNNDAEKQPADNPKSDNQNAQQQNAQQMQHVQIHGPISVEPKRRFRFTVGAFGKLSFGAWPVDLSKKGYTISRGSSESVLYGFYHALKDAEGEKWDFNKDQTYRNNADLIDKLKFLSPARIFTGGLLFEGLSNFDSDLKYGGYYSYAFKTEFEFGMKLAYRYKKFLPNFGVGMAIGDIGYKNQAIEFDMTSVGVNWHIGLDYAITEHIDIFLQYSQTFLSILSYHSINFGIKHYVY